MREIHRASLVRQGRARGPAGTFDVTLSYAKFYVKYHLSSLRTLKKEQATVRPSLSKLLGVVTISRRSAAGGWLRYRAAARRAAQTSASAWRARCARSCERLSRRRASRKHGCTAVGTCLAPAVPATAGGGRPSEADEQPTSEECAEKNDRGCGTLMNF